MTKIEFAVDRNPNPGQSGSGIIAIVNGAITPVGPQNFSGDQQAISALLRALGELVKPSPA